MQNGGLLNSCNGLTTTALQFGIPILLLIYYAGDIGDNAFHMVGLVTEPVLQGLGIKYIVMRDPAKVKQEIAGAVTLANSFETTGGAIVHPRGAVSESDYETIRMPAGDRAVDQRRTVRHHRRRRHCRMERRASERRQHPG